MACAGTLCALWPAALRREQNAAQQNVYLCAHRRVARGDFALAGAGEILVCKPYTATSRSGLCTYFFVTPYSAAPMPRAPVWVRLRILLAGTSCPPCTVLMHCHTAQLCADSSTRSVRTSLPWLLASAACHPAAAGHATCRALVLQRSTGAVHPRTAGFARLTTTRSARRARRRRGRRRAAAALRKGGACRGARCARG